MQAQVKIFCEIIVESNIDVLREVLKQIIISSSSKFFYPVTDRVYSFPGVFLPTQFAHGGVEAVKGEGEHAVVENLFDDVG